MIFIFEKVIEMAQIVKTGVHGNINNCGIAVDQLVGTVIQAKIIDIVSGGGLQFFFKKPADIGQPPAA